MTAAVALSGATGFFGTHVARALAARGVPFVAMQHRAGAAVPGAVQVWRHDLARAASLPHAPMPPTLLHLAWQGLPDYRARHHLEQVGWHFEFLRACLDAGTTHLVVTGTCLEYGMRSGECAEDAEVAPVTAYAQAKHRLHAALAALQRERRFRLTWLRPFYLFGPGQAATSLYSSLRAAVAAGQRVLPISPGDQVRDFIAVEEAAADVVRLAMQPDADGTWNLCSGRPTTVRARIEAWLREWGNPPIELDAGRLPYPDYEPFAYWGSRHKLAAFAGNA